MKEGTLVYHPEWGKGLVVEKLFHINGDDFPPCCARAVEQAQDHEEWRKVDNFEDLRRRTYHLVGDGRMKVGTLIQHRTWGKGFVTEVLGSQPFEPIRVRWLNPYTHVTG